MGSIYLIENMISGKIYIGSTDRNFQYRKKEHKYDLRHNKHDNQYLQNSWNKYGESAFVFTEIEKTDNPEHTHERELYWVNYYVLLWGEDYVYNIKPVERSAFGRKKKAVTEDTRAKMRESSRKRFETPIEREKNRQAAIAGQQRRKENGYILIQSEDAKRKLSEAAKERYANGFKIELKPLTEQHREAISNAQSKVWKGFISPDGIVYRDVVNLVAFCKQYSLDNAAMQRVANGKSKTHKGWKRIEE